MQMGRSLTDVQGSLKLAGLLWQSRMAKGSSHAGAPAFVCARLRDFEMPQHMWEGLGFRVLCRAPFCKEGP